MSKRQILTHHIYCELMINRKPSRIYSVGGSKREFIKPVKGIKQTGEGKEVK